MELSRIVPPAPALTGESLSTALLTLLRSVGVDADPDRVTASLGIPFLTMTTTSREPRDWRQAGRDLQIEWAASLFGIRTRDLHPRAAAAGVLNSAEFQQHFTDSYLPLIVRALDHQQPVLVHGGWPAPAMRNWGIVTGRDRQGRLVGVVEGHAEIVPLELAASQCYVVEEMRPVQPTITEVAACVAHVCAASLADLPAGDLLVGEAAWTMCQDMVASAESVAPLAGYIPFAAELQGSRRIAQRFAQQVLADPSTPSAAQAAWSLVLTATISMISRLGDLIVAIEHPDPATPAIPAIQRIVGELRTLDRQSHHTLAALTGEQSATRSRVRN